MKKRLFLARFRDHGTRALLYSLAGVAAITMTGCPSKSSGTGAATGPDPYANMTGNWQIQATPTSGSAPFAGLSGNFFEEATTTAAHATTASLLAQSAGCYATSGTVPLRGNVEQPDIALTSFNVDGQVLTITATKDEAALTLTGTYSIAGGCGNGYKGTLTGMRYSALTGTFVGALAADPTKTIQLSLAQTVLGTSGGTFLTSGSAVFGGIPCFTTGSSISGESYVSGANVILTFNTGNIATSQVTLIGTFDQAATTITLTSMQITGGSCAATYGGATLPLKA